MLQGVEILDRRVVRRGVHLGCDVVSTYFEEPVEHVVVDLSEQGMFVETVYPFEVGEHLFVSFRPPRSDREILVSAVVRRVEMFRRAGERQRSGMGLEFLDLSAAEHAEIEMVLRGLPPPLPRGRRRFLRDLVWVDEMLMWADDCDGRVAEVFDVSEALGPVAEEDFEIEPLSEPLQLAS